MSSPNPRLPSPLLRLEKVTKKFGSVTAVRDVDLEIYSGDFIALFGPNGAGKTTLLKIIASLTRPTRGEVVFSRDGGKASGLIGYVSHQSLLYNDMSAEENLEFYARIYSLPSGSTRVSELLKKMGLWEVRKQLVRGYSRGMKQRLTLARALLHEPQLLLLDEPYTGLDQHAGRVFTEMLRELKKEGRTILLVTHNLVEGLALCSRVIIQHRGKIVFEARREGVDQAAFEGIYFREVEK